MGIDEVLVQEIVRRILSVARPDKIILFGSAATGAMTSDSDIDLLIVEPEPGDRREEYVRIRRAFPSLRSGRVLRGFRPRFARTAPRPFAR